MTQPGPTPAAPDLPTDSGGDAPAASEAGSAGAPSRGGRIRDALRAGLDYVRRSWRVLLVVVLVQLALALTVVMPFWTAIAPHLDHHVHTTALAGAPDAYDRALGWEAGMDPGIWRDIEREEKSVFDGLAVAHWWIAVVAWLFGALAAGGFLGTAAPGAYPIRVGPFLQAGGRHFARMLRVGLVFALAYYVCARVVFELWALSVEPDERMASSEATGWWAARVREAIFVLLFLWFRVAADIARADLVVRGRTGAVRAFFRGLARALRPRSWLTALTLGLPAFLLLLGFSLATGRLAGDGWIVLVLLFLVFQLAVLLRWASRAAVIVALARVSEPA